MKRPRREHPRYLAMRERERSGGPLRRWATLLGALGGAMFLIPFLALGIFVYVALVVTAAHDGIAALIGALTPVVIAAVVVFWPTKR